MWNKSARTLNRGSSCHDLRARICDLLWDRVVDTNTEDGVIEIMEARNEAIRASNAAKRSRVLAQQAAAQK